MKPSTLLPFALALSGAALPALAQTSGAPAAPPGSPDAGWRQCSALQDGPQRLACFDQWAGRQAWTAPAASANTTLGTGGGDAATAAALAALPAPETAPQPEPVIALKVADGCRDGDYTTLSRFWELEAGTDCGPLRFRGYRPINVSVVAGSNVNRQPTSSNPNNSATQPVDYRRAEMRVQLSVRTKLASDLLTRGDARLRDSLWVGYTQQSYWQLFSSNISRPFRNTDHEPEIMYVYPTQAKLPFGWQWRYSGIGLVHQSNGQSDPLSRSWNRAYLMTGFELNDRFSLTARVWKRLHESAGSDNNPGISDTVGRSEFTLGWNATPHDRLTLTTRHALAGSWRGSARLDWMQSLGTRFAGPRSNLRLHTQLFSGYGDSLIDYNRKRTVFSVGLSLVDF
ncbi:phospholipase A1 [Oryzisolibacter propanilivorax]|uniref:Phospholipase A1 n=1 Tax=Oryzisolibacter propanilivorax TaxID=1527607 RepID=A0A1G9V7A2_9BURK|nr:phospholipase A [Oryzisolibacter propanilivorax]SDM67980.1 phospholipase A1 [Oryzisolibacter propanilivorax]